MTLRWLDSVGPVAAKLSEKNVYVGRLSERLATIIFKLDLKNEEPLWLKSAKLFTFFASLGGFLLCISPIYILSSTNDALRRIVANIGGGVTGLPAGLLRRVVRFLTTPKGFRDVFEPTFADMDAEYFEALSRKEHFEAWKIVVACHLKVGMLLAARPVVRALATMMGWMKAG